MDEAKEIFANIFRDYWVTSYRRERIETKEKYDRQKMEEEKINAEREYRQLKKH